MPSTATYATTNTYSNSNLALAAGPLHWQRTNRRHSCPVCGGRQGKCSFAEGATSMLVACHYTPSDKRAGGIIPAWLHRIDNLSALATSSSNPRPARAAQLHSTGLGDTSPELETALKPLPAHQVDAICRRIRQLTPLTEVHRHYLKAEGLALAQIAECSSLSYKQASRIAARIVMEFTPEVARRHPAIIRCEATDGRTWWTLASAADGILFPALDNEGRILGFQIRKDNPRGKDDRYRWLSHDGLGGTPLTILKAAPMLIPDAVKVAISKPGANSAGDTPLAFSQFVPANTNMSMSSQASSMLPFASSTSNSGPSAHATTTTTSMLSGVPAVETLLITEGFKKAAVACTAWNWHAISLAGVTAYKIGELAAAITQLAPKTIYLAFDQDKREKPAVKEAETRLVNLLAGLFPNIRLEILTWDIEKGKGLDDALKARAQITSQSALPQTRAGRVVLGLPQEAHARAFGNLLLRRIYALSEARQLHVELMERLVREVEPSGEQLCVTSTTGTGKSTSADNVIANYLLDGWLNKRVLILAPNKENIAERTSPDKPLGKAVALGLAAIQRGRRYIEIGSGKPQASTPEDCANPDAGAAGQARHIPARVVCSSCVFGSAANWEKMYPGQPRPFECETDGYIASRKRSKLAQVVIATKEAYLNNSKELDSFGLVVCDEEILPYLIDHAEVSRDVIADWESHIQSKRIEDAESWQDLFGVLKETLVRLQARPQAEQPIAGRIVPVNELVRVVAAELLDIRNLTQLISECKYEALPPAKLPANETYSFELPYEQEGILKLPYRAAYMLIRGLERADSPVYARRNADGSYSFELYEIKQALVEKLRAKTLVILDSTMPPHLKLLLPGLTEVSFEVPQNMLITQAVSGLYSKRDFHREETRVQIAKVTAGFIARTRARKPLVLIPQKFQEGKLGIRLPEWYQSEHWGLHRATNRYCGSDAIIMMGHHVRPIDRITAEVKCIKAGLGIAPATEAGTASTVGEHEESKVEKKKLRLYNHLDRNGETAGVWFRQTADKDVQEAIEHDYYSHIIQAIGRARAALRPAGEPPVQVLILCNEPVGNLKIDRLVTVRQLLREAELERTAPAQVVETTGAAGEGAAGEAGYFTTPTVPLLTNPYKNISSTNNIYVKVAKTDGSVMGSEQAEGEETLPPTMEETAVSQAQGSLYTELLPDLPHVAPDEDTLEVAIGDFTPQRK